MGNKFKRIVASCLAAVICITCFCWSDSLEYSISADTMSELEAKQKELAKQRKDLESSMSAIEGKADEQDEYLAEYNEKMKIQEQEIEVVKEQIALLETDIEQLNLDIEQKQIDVDKGIEQFRKRLRALYISGNDSLASVIAGSNDFYDMLARMELVERISEHDNQMIEDLKTMIQELETSKKELEQDLSDLQAKKAEQEKNLAELQKTYNNHAETKAMYEAKWADYEKRSDQIEVEEAQVEQALQEEIRRKQEELERKRKEEEERRRKEEELRRQQAEANGQTYVPDNTPSTPSYSATGFIWPVPTVRNMSDKYGNRWIVEEQKSNFHKGIDITKPGCGGSEIVAAAAGTVITAANTGNGYGYHVVIDHGDKISTLYGHCSSLAVSAGQEVTQGQVLGYIGHTGYAYGDHLHFEVRINGQHTDPLNYVSVNN